jgi:hypothetical protein
LKEEPTKIVEFLLHKSLPDKNPTIVKRERDFTRSLMVSDPIPEVLSPSSDTKEVNFCGISAVSRTEDV